MGQEPVRPQVRVVDPAGRAAPPTAGRTRGPGRRAALVLALALVAGLLLWHRQERPPWRVEPARLRADGALTVTLVNSGPPVRVTGVRLAGERLAATAPAALTDEARTAEAAGVPPAHDADRPLGRGTHTFVLPVRAQCPGAGAAPDVLLDVMGADSRRTAVSRVPSDAVARLGCPPVTLRAGLSPVAAPAGHVRLLLTAHVAERAGPVAVQALGWPGYRVQAVAVGPQVLGRAGIEETVYFDADVTPDCSSPATGALVAVLDTGELPVPLTSAAAARVAGLRPACG